MVHGDDYVSTGEDHDLEWLKEEMGRRFEIKTQLRGHDHTKEGRVLNQIIRATEEGWEYEADQRHGEYIIRAMRLMEAKGVSSPGEDDKTGLEGHEADALDKQTATEYRGLAARANFLDSVFNERDILGQLKNVPQIINLHAAFQD